MPAKVWIVKEQMMRGDLGSVAMDYSPAMKYGELEFITTIDLPLHARSMVHATWGKEVDRFVKEYDGDTDFIITTGQPLAIFMIGWMLGYFGKTAPTRFLVWRPQENQYRVVDTLDLTLAIA